jgi:basic membrane protein A
VNKRLKITTLAALTLSAMYANAASEPAVVYDSAGKFDKSFNEAVFRNALTTPIDTLLALMEA